MRSTPEPGDQTAQGDLLADAVSNAVSRADLRLELRWETHDVTGDFFRELVNRQLRTYKTIIQWGGKAGQSYFGHVLDLVLLFERLNALVSLPDVERRCLYCACVVHDLNKVPPYNRWAGGRHYLCRSSLRGQHSGRVGTLRGLSASSQPGVTTWRISSPLRTCTR